MTKTISSYLLFTLLLLLSQNAYSQKQSWNWYFGDSAGVSFRNGAPAVLPNGSMSAGEGCASISDSSGNLLFYTDGISVYNANHAVMPGGTGLAGAPSSSQSAIIIKKPGSQKLYYIFTVDENFNNGAKGFRYSIVDMSLGGGLGGVDPANKNVLVRGGVMEKLTAARHRNNSDFWILIADFTEDKIFAYRLSCSGLDPIPVKSNVGPISSGNWRSTFGYMKVSRQDNRIAVALWDARAFLLADFDNSNGVASNRITITNTLGKIENYPYGVEFSPNGNLLYGTTLDGPRGLILSNLFKDTLRLYQFDLSSGNANTISNSLVVLASHTTIKTPNYSFYYGALQLGPDGKIYSVNAYDTVLGVINNPDAPGLSCGYVNNGINLGRRACRLGLPNILNNYIAPVYDTVKVTICANHPYTLCDGSLIRTTGIYVCHASTPTACDSIIITKITVLPIDTTTSGATVCSVRLPYAWNGQNLTQSGTYYHTVTAASGCDSILRLNLAVEPNPVQTINRSICQGEVYLGHGSTGTYIDTIRVTNGCDTIRTVNLTVQPLPVANAGMDSTVCYGKNIQLTGSGGTEYIWSPSTYLDNPAVSNPVSHPEETITYGLSVKDANGCLSPQKDEITVTVIHPKISAGRDTILFQNQVLQLHATGIGNSLFTQYDWTPASGLNDPGLQDPVADITGDITYRLVATTAEGCTAIDEISIKVSRAAAIYMPTAFTPNGDGLNDLLKPLTVGIKEIEYFRIYNRWGQAVFDAKVNTGWDGTFLGKRQATGAFVWMIKAIDLKGKTILIKGIVSLIR